MNFNEGVLAIIAILLSLFVVLVVIAIGVWVRCGVKGLILANFFPLYSSSRLVASLVLFSITF